MTGNVVAPAPRAEPACFSNGGSEPIIAVVARNYAAIPAVIWGGQAAGIVSSLSGLRNDTRFLQISAAVQPGNSGGPLFDTSGQVVGVVSAKLDPFRIARVTVTIPENVNFAIKTGMLRDFLDNSVVPYQTADAKSELTTPDIARNARAFTLLVICSAPQQSANAKKSDD